MDCRRGRGSGPTSSLGTSSPSSLPSFTTSRAPSLQQALAGSGGPAPRLLWASLLSCHSFSVGSARPFRVWTYTLAPVTAWLPDPGLRLCLCFLSLHPWKSAFVSTFLLACVHDLETWLCLPGLVFSVEFPVLTPNCPFICLSHPASRPIAVPLPPTHLCILTLLLADVLSPSLGHPPGLRSSGVQGKESRAG